MDDTAMITSKGQSRRLTPGERALARSMYGETIDLSGVEIRRRKWAFFQPRNVAMAPMGHIHFHPESAVWSEDYSKEELGLSGLFIHELCHVWQTQRGIFLPLKRHPFCTYNYVLKPGWKLERYGLEQQAEIVRHAYLLRHGHSVPGAPELHQYDSILALMR